MTKGMQTIKEKNLTTPEYWKTYTVFPVPENRIPVQVLSRSIRTYGRTVSTGTFSPWIRLFIR